MQRGDRLVVQVDLVDASNERQIWGERFNRSCGRYLRSGGRDRAANRRAAAAEARETRTGTRRHDRSTDDPLAYDLYLRARHHWARRTPDSMRLAIEYLEAAIARDSTFARAWAGLADTRTLFAWYGLGRPAGAVRGGDSRQPDRSTARARTWRGARRAGFLPLLHRRVGRRSARLRAGGASQSQLFPRARLVGARAVGRAAASTRRWRTIGRAKRVEPLSLVVHHHEAWVNVMAGRFADAARIAQAALELDGGYSFGWWWLGIAQTELGETDAAVQSLERAQRIFGTFQIGHSALGHGYGRAGRPDAARATTGCPPGSESGVRRSLPLRAGTHRARRSRRGIGLSDPSIRNQLHVAPSYIGPHDPRLNAIRGDDRFASSSSVAPGTA